MAPNSKKEESARTPELAMGNHCHDISSRLLKAKMSKTFRIFAVLTKYSIL
jgi:hypothetical protein